MGEVIPIRRIARRRIKAAAPEGSAQILFFLGVRYCRDGDDVDARSSGRRRAGSATSRSRRKKRA